MVSESENESSYARYAAAYREAAGRDPRDFPFGYLAGDPASGARGCFVWFATTGELIDFMIDTEVGLLQFDEPDANVIAAGIRRVMARTFDLSRAPRDELTEAFCGWCEILWLGTFGNLCSRGGDVQTSVRLAFRRARSLGEHAGPIADDEVDAFVEFLRELAMASVEL
ncbi:MAG TPA: hypothetical protein VIS07_00935 [Candidatus Binatia bacterium]